MKIRKADARDVSRIAEILVFVKRMNYRAIFHDDEYSFNELQVLSVAKEYSANEMLEHIWVYDDGIVKGMIRIDGAEIKELYVEHFFQGEGVGAELIEFAKDEHHAKFLWVLEKNVDAIRFYERHGFRKTDAKKFEAGTTEKIVLMEC